jgi:hypothetical protein
MDADKDGQVSFSEFQIYASAQAESYDQSRIYSLYIKLKALKVIVTQK